MGSISLSAIIKLAKASAGGQGLHPIQLWIYFLSGLYCENNEILSVYHNIQPFFWREMHLCGQSVRRWGDGVIIQTNRKDGFLSRIG